MTALTESEYVSREILDLLGTSQKRQGRRRSGEHGGERRRCIATRDRTERTKRKERHVHGTGRQARKHASTYAIFSLPAKSESAARATHTCSQSVFSFPDGFCQPRLLFVLDFPCHWLKRAMASESTPLLDPGLVWGQGTEAWLEQFRACGGLGLRLAT